MRIRLLYGRRVQIYLKIIACIVIGIFYFTFLFRESINAFEQNKEREKEREKEKANAIGLNSKLEERPDTNLLKYLQQKQQNKHVTPQQPLTSAISPTIVSTTINPVYEYSEEIHTATEKDLQRRKNHLNNVCKQYRLESYYPPNPWEFFISPGHNLVWCNIFKAASSTWMYYFNILGGYDVRFLQATKIQPLELARKRFPRPQLTELYESLSSSLSFLFVREPFERIVSAYRNKLEGGRNSFYKVLAHKIIQKYRNGTVNGGRSRLGPTFEEFLHYLIGEYTQKRTLDEHWAPVYSFCTPCSVNFTIIGKVETFQRDAEFIIRMAGLESLLLGKLPKHKWHKIGNTAAGERSDALIEKYFSEINRETLDQLLNIYRLDFELFDYNYTKYYDLSLPANDKTLLTEVVTAALVKENSSSYAINGNSSTTGP